MRFKIALALTTLALAVFPALAQENAPNVVSFNGFSFHYDPALGNSVNIQRVPGDPAADAGPGFSDAAKTQFTLYDFGEPMDSLFDTGGVRVYWMADVAQYDFLQAIVDQLETLLAERPDLASFESGVNNPAVGGLPYLPAMTHGQTFAARAQYVQTEAVAGIRYLTMFQAALEPFTGQEILYTFQGISADGQYYINITFPLRTALFSETPLIDPVTFQQEWPTYLAESIVTLNEAAPDAFVPSLDAADALVQSMRFAAGS